MKTWVCPECANEYEYGGFAGAKPTTCDNCDYGKGIANPLDDIIYISKKHGARLLPGPSACKIELVWETMETAPKDGSVIIALIDFGLLDTVRSIRWDGEDWVSCTLEQDIEKLYGSFSPKYWFPMPLIKGSLVHG